MGGGCGGAWHWTAWAGGVSEVVIRGWALV